MTDHKVVGHEEWQAAREELLRAIFDQMRARLRRFLRAERAAGRLSDAADPTRPATFAIAAVQGGLLLGLLERRPTPVRAALDEAFAHLQSFVRASPDEEE